MKAPFFLFFAVCFYSCTDLDQFRPELQIKIDKLSKAEIKLNPTQKDTLINLVLLNHNYLDISNWMIQEIKPNPKFYSIIKRKAITPSEKCGIQMGATYALSKFKKREDIELLKK